MEGHCRRCEEQDVPHRHRPPQGHLSLLDRHRLCRQPRHAGEQDGSTSAKTHSRIICKHFKVPLASWENILYHFYEWVVKKPKLDAG